MTKPNFDQKISRIGTHAMKWDGMQSSHGVSPADGIPMWVADMDFRPPASVQAAVQKMADHGIYGYFGDDAEYLAAIRWWMANRHQWNIENEWVFTTHGLVNGTAMCVDAFSAPGDGIVLMAPVYHAFARVITAAGRQAVQWPLKLVDGRYEMDLAAWQQMLTGNEKMVVLCSPHNPGGRVWTATELAELARFCRENNLLLVSDEIHHDLVFDGSRHTVMANAAPNDLDRMIIMSAGTKTFNLAGAHVGNVIIPDQRLREQFGQRMRGLGMSPNAFGVHMITAAYSPDGAAWLAELMAYLDNNRKIFDAGVNAISGVQSMPLESTYLAWVDFSGTGLTDEALTDKVRQEAKIAANLGPTFGPGGESYLRFNLATQQSRVEDAVARLQRTFG